MKALKQTAAQKLGKVSKKEELIAMRIKRAIELTQEMKDIKSELDGIKEFFAQEIFKGEKTKQKYVSEYGIVEQTIRNDYEVLAQYVPAIRDLFKKKTDDFINVKSTYKPTAKLRELLLDADYENIELLRDAVQIKTSTSLAFEPIPEPKMRIAK